VTHLRQIMLEELERRNYAPGTIRSYIRTVEHFARHFHRAPDQLGPEHIRQYQAAMFREWKLSQNTVSQRLGALRFFYTQVLKQTAPFSTPHPLMCRMSQQRQPRSLHVLRHAYLRCVSSQLWHQKNPLNYLLQLPQTTDIRVVHERDQPTRTATPAPPSIQLTAVP
jgi:hypothetical protein